MKFAHKGMDQLIVEWHDADVIDVIEKDIIMSRRKRNILRSVQQV